ncbi:hypothetical protein PENTCL1PPCAC_25605, partial [Pristionchus entomophagus]
EITPDYGNSAGTVILIVLASLALGRIIEWTNLPSLLGMLLAGIALRNIPLSIFAELTVPREWATVLRRASFVVILLRGALSLDGESLKKTKGACLRLSLLPCSVEAVVIALVSMLIFDISILFGLLLGFLLAAASPAVVVPSILKVAQDGYGSHLASMIIASCSLDDVYNISMFSVLLSIIFSTGDSILVTVIRAPIQVIAGCFLGGIVGYLGRFVQRESRFSLLLSTSLAIYFSCVYWHIDSCGTLAVLVAAFLAVKEWRKNQDCNSEQVNLRLLWDFLFQPLLFGLIGFDLQLDTLTWKLVLLGCAILAIGVTVRTIVAFFAVMGAGLTTKERAFVALSWPSKATVQAALATAAIDLANKGDYGDEYKAASNIVFSLAVLSILVTAPIGAILIRISAPILL